MIGKELTKHQIKHKMRADFETLELIHNIVFTMANSYAGDEYGFIAQLLHQVHNDTITVEHKLLVESVRDK